MQQQSSTNSTEITLDGHHLTASTLMQIAAGAVVKIAPHCHQKMAQSQAVIARAVTEQWPVYGLTTGLGPNVNQSLDPDSIDQFSLQTLRGRAHSIGAPMPRQQVRAALAVRLNTLLIGATGVRPDLADFLCQCLNRDIAPVVGETASIGAADLLAAASCGLALCGEGELLDQQQQPAPAAEIFAAAGLQPWQPAAREGLALASHSGFSAALAAHAMHEVAALIGHAQLSVALVFEGFRANLSPIDARVLALRPQPGQQAAADGLYVWLSGSALHHAGQARRLQDPLSIRNAIQGLAAVHACTDLAASAVAAELNGVTDNPATLIADQQILSHGAYLSPLLTVSLTALCQALYGLAAHQLARIGKLLFERFSGLPNGLCAAHANSAGLAPLLKVAEALHAEIAHLTQLPVQAPSVSADGLEDCATHAPLAARSLLTVASKLKQLTAIEMLVACHAIRMRQSQPSLAEPLAAKYCDIEQISPPITQDRSLSAEIHAIVAYLP